MVRLEDLYEGARLRVVRASPDASKRNGDCWVNGDVWPVKLRKGKFHVRCAQSCHENDDHECEFLRWAMFDLEPGDGPW